MSSKKQRRKVKKISATKSGNPTSIPASHMPSAPPSISNTSVSTSPGSTEDSVSTTTSPHLLSAANAPSIASFVSSPAEVTVAPHVSSSTRIVEALTVIAGGNASPISSTRSNSVAQAPSSITSLGPSPANISPHSLLLKRPKASSVPTGSVSSTRSTPSNSPAKIACATPMVTPTTTSKQSSTSVPPSPDIKDTTVRVYVLSVLLNAMQRVKRRLPSKVLGPSDSVRNSESSVVGQTLNEIATLLSRGIPNETPRIIAVVAGPLTMQGIAIQVIRSNPPTSGTAEGDEPLVTSTSTSQTADANDLLTPFSTLFTSGDPSENGVRDKENVHFVRNSSHTETQDSKVFQDTVVKANRKYTDICRKTPVPFRPASSYSFEKFTQVFFRVFQAAAEYDLPVTAAMFCMSQCAAKVKMRCCAVCNIYTKEDALKRWRPTEGEIIERSNVATSDPTVQHQLKEHGVDSGTSLETQHFPFSKENAHLWLHTLLGLMTLFRTSVDKLVSTHSRENVADATFNSMDLNRFLSLIPLSFWTPSLDIALSNILTPELSEIEVAEITETWVPSQGGQRPGPPRDRQACLTFFRLVDSLTVWTTSAISLAASRFAKSSMSLNYTLLNLPHHPPQIDVSSIPDMIKGFVTTLGLHADENQTKLQKTWDENFQPDQISGTCHCEAGIMASTVINGIVATEDAPFIIGVAKKSCPFCWMLSESLAKVRHKHFKLPGAHNLFFPWHPPPLPLEVLLDLEKKALQRLLGMIRIERGICETSTSSPATSHTGDPSGEVGQKAERATILETLRRTAEWASNS